MNTNYKKQVKKNIAKLLKNCPIGYTDGQEDNAICMAHFFNPIGRGDWYVLEAFKEDGNVIFYGYVDLIFPELGYFTLNELTKNHIEMDLYWSPKSLKEIKEECLKNISY